MLLHVSSKSAHRQEAKIVLYNLWYHHTYRWPSGAQVEQQQRAGIKKRKLFLTDIRMGLFGSDRGQGSGEKNVIQNVS